MHAKILQMAAGKKTVENVFRSLAKTGTIQMNTCEIPKYTFNMCLFQAMQVVFINKSTATGTYTLYKNSERMRHRNSMLAQCMEDNAINAKVQMCIA